MVDFRRCFTVLAILALFVGLAGAQGGINSSPLQCQTNPSVTPTLRSEGYTEQTGDITINCTGGNFIPAGGNIPQVNITLTYNTAVTSRLLPVTGSSNQSEALLLIDEPGSGLAGANPTQILCTTPLTGCAQQVFSASYLPVSCVTITSGTCTGGIGQNVFQGIVSGNQVTFFGVPILPPVTTSFCSVGGVTNTGACQRVIRITNVRVNATALSGGSAAGATPVVASVSTNPAVYLPIGNPTPTVGFVQAGLTVAASGTTNQNQCSSVTRTSVSTLTYTENFPTAFKTRVSAQTNTTYAGQSVPSLTSTPPNQNVPGAIYNSESNFVFGPMPGGGTAGLTDYGTRLRATFSNVPAGVRIFVSTVNVNNNAQPYFFPSAPGFTIGGSAQNTVAPVAQLVSSSTIGDGTSGGFFPSVTATDVPATGNTPIVEITPVNGVYTAVWEVVNTNPNTNEALKFGVYDTYVANVGQNSPPPGTATVTMSFAPAPSDFSASAGAAASSTLTIPRFIAGTGSSNILAINICRTVLLYPYVVNVQGFDTGLAVANTSTDPFGTSPQAGNCNLNWYQGTSNPPITVLGAGGAIGTVASPPPVIPSGTTTATLASTAVPGFSGYMIAVCNFQFAHGFAFVSDVGARNLAMGYLAVVLPDPGSNNGGTRNPTMSGCGSTAGSSGGVSCGTGEAGGH